MRRRHHGTLSVFLAVWTDGVERVLHCHDLDDAWDFARKLSRHLPLSVAVESVTLLEI